jgi:hypothetical protein
MSTGLWGGLRAASPQPRSERLSRRFDVRWLATPPVKARPACSYGQENKARAENTKCQPQSIELQIPQAGPIEEQKQFAWKVR